MEDVTTNQLMVGIILAIVGHAITVLVKSPKEAIKQLAVEVTELREAQVLSTERWARHDEIAKGLGASLNALSTRLDRLEPYVSKAGHGRAR